MVNADRLAERKEELERELHKGLAMEQHLVAQLAETRQRVENIKGAVQVLNDILAEGEGPFEVATDNA